MASFSFETQAQYFDTSEEALDRAVDLYWIRRNEKHAGIKVRPWNVPPAIKGLDGKTRTV